jgi:hypothetical protein
MVTGRPINAAIIERVIPCVKDYFAAQKVNLNRAEVADRIKHIMRDWWFWSPWNNVNLVHEDNKVEGPGFRINSSGGESFFVSYAKVHYLNDRALDKVLRDLFPKRVVDWDLRKRDEREFRFCWTEKQRMGQVRN